MPTESVVLGLVIFISHGTNHITNNTKAVLDKLLNTSIRIIGVSRMQGADSPKHQTITYHRD
jgi:cobalamin biosynthesis Co2+ chelatase CbiK